MKIAVTGGKGGTGKSTVATALAVELGKEKKVLLVDADADCPDDHLLLGINREKVNTVTQRIPKWNLNKCTECGECAKACEFNAIALVNKKPVFMQNQCSGCGACLVVCPENAVSWTKKEIGCIYSGKKHSINYLGGELKVNEAVSERVVDALNEEISGSDYDFVIVDTAAGTHCDVISALEGTDLAIVVTEPTPLGAHDLELIIELLNVLNVDFEIVLNRVGIGEKKLIEEIAEKNGTKIASRVPYSKKIMESYSKGKPVKHKSIKELKGLIE